ncbi:hypothetical protein [Rothia kristinae]|nr:hypothetical protein [Rothia kristinae]
MTIETRETPAVSADAARSLGAAWPALLGLCLAMLVEMVALHR